MGSLCILPNVIPCQYHFGNYTYHLGKKGGQYQFWKLQSKANIPRSLLKVQVTKPNQKFDRERGDLTWWGRSPRADTNMSPQAILSAQPQNQNHQ